jgi:multiple sugar transport system permease protein
LTLASDSKTGHSRSKSDPSTPASTPALRTRERSNLLKGLAFLSPWLVGFSLFTLLPIGLSLYYSFCDFTLLQPPVYRGLENYRDLATDPVFWQALKVISLFALMALPLGMLASLGLALLLNAKVRGQTIYRAIIFLPSLVPAVAAAVVWIWLYNPKLGLINLGLRKIGISDPPGWLSDPNWSLSALVLMSLWGIGNTVIIYLAGLQDVPRELYEAAELDGAGTAGKIWHVTIPGISPVIFFNLIMAIIGTLQQFTLPFIMTPSGQPGRATYFYTMYLYDNAFTYLKMGFASGMSWILLLMILALTGLAFWTSRRWVYYQGK